MKTIKDIALEKLQKYCAYQDRCHSEVRNKLLSIEVYGDDLEDIICSLIENKFLDELRYAKSFVRGKFKMKEWGRIKIIHALKAKQVSEYCIKKGLEEIDYDEYIVTLNKLIEKNQSRYGDLEIYKNKQKLIKYLLNRGYEMSLILEYVNKYLKDSA